MATINDLESYYSNLLALQYRNQPNAVATIQLIVNWMLMQLLPFDVQQAFTLSSAQGVQLDMIARYVGVTRNGYGFSGQAISLDDADFIQLIQMAILTNHSDASLNTIQNLLHTYFPGLILVFDHQNMTLSYLVNTSIGSNNLVQMFISQNLLPQPMGVQISATIYAGNITSFFGYVTYEYPYQINNSPLNTYESYVMTRPILVYEDAISA